MRSSSGPSNHGSTDPRKTRVSTAMEKSSQAEVLGPTAGETISAVKTVDANASKDKPSGAVVYVTLSGGIARLPLLAKFLSSGPGVGSGALEVADGACVEPEVKIIWLRAGWCIRWRAGWPVWLPFWPSSWFKRRFSGSVFKAVLAWGRRLGTERARALACSLDVPCVALEDGFLRSFGTGERFAALAMVQDRDGIYYDSRTASALESLLNSSQDLCAGIEDKIDRALAKLVALGLSKYNHAPDLDLDWNLDLNLDSDSGLERRHTLGGPCVLVIDQTVGDMSVTYGGASGETFKTMLAAALSENPDASILVKTHPEVSSGRKGGYLTDVGADSRIVLLRDAVNPASLFASVDRVYVVSSTMGFEALLHGKKVSCFGVPWYAGWGVTDDRMVCERRSRQRSVRELFAAAYLHYTTYIDPLTHEPGEIDAVIDWLGHQKLMAKRLHGERLQGRVFVLGFARWKVYNLKAMLGLMREQVMAVTSVQKLQSLCAHSALHNRPIGSGDTVVVWGAYEPTGLLDLQSLYGFRVLHAEDGFVRSVGLGSDMIRPLSLVLDERGVYFDATRVSDMEHLLQTGVFSQSELERACAVRQFIVANGITKYNLDAFVGSEGFAGVSPNAGVMAGVSAGSVKSGVRVVLVPGQVEDDASIQLGCTTVTTNLGLLRAVRTANPEAWIVYKPHPDVVSGNRRGKVHLSQALRYADHVELDRSVIDCISACDEVHTMTSLAGFDALVRGKRVVTYGEPFYAGWGLTEDRCEGGRALARRTRLLSLDELVAGVLLKYPIYWDWQLQGYTTCEAVLRRLVDERDALERAGQLHHLKKGVVRRAWRKARVWLAAWCSV